ncbi:hypothetical protein LJ655_08255 [Paraburkholderia sp. MMS20-SJTN17]|uniref:Tripartite tricarboxylate transporter TctB family protein n=1 Tax=Paraburkholderia translucens TaxID=2886945 RepID=A0ABS8KAT0_9BURK|nr:hypothetical protein [Paraburkholderia sp. MMS20-SJTN17]MCC8401883.1 hypothetical protein [Paraburkholderia sp. MMS20-SJTN17]
MKIMLRKEADRYIYGVGALLALPILSVFSYNAELPDMMAYFAAATAIVAALVMGRPVFPIEMPTGPNAKTALENIVDQQTNFRMGAKLLVIAGLALLPALIKNWITFRYSMVVMETFAVGWAITAGVRAYLEDGKFPFLRPVIWGVLLLMAIVVNSTLISWSPLLGP